MENLSVKLIITGLVIVRIKSSLIVRFNESPWRTGYFADEMKIITDLMIAYDGIKVHLFSI